MNPLIHALISYRLTENFSIEGCGRWLQNPIVGREFGIPGKVSSRMLNRAVETVGIDMGPLRIWSDDSVRGILTICFLAQMIVPMVRYEHVKLSGLSTKTIIRSLERLTLTVISGEKKRKNRIYSNFEPVNCLVLGVKPPPDTVPVG